MTTVDDYIQNVIGLGDQGSRLLAARSALTLRNNTCVTVVQDGMNGIAVLRVPKEYHLVIHAASGDPRRTDVREHALSLVERLVQQAYHFSAEPLGFANVIDSSTGDTAMLETIIESLVEKSHEHGIAILNGENAILGERVVGQANVSGTMISMISKRKLGPGNYGGLNGTNMAVLDHQGQLVYINSDGVGTKTEFYERARFFERALEDAVAMKVDDAIKIGAKPILLTDVVETKGRIPRSRLQRHAERLGETLKIPYMLHFATADARIQGWSDTSPAYNISGSVVSLIDEQRLRQLPRPAAGEQLIAIHEKDPNPRSNGITDKRRTMTNLFGNTWHDTPFGKVMLTYLITPSVILYPVFRRLLDEQAATSFYHMSGGAFNGKLARPLAKNDLFVDIHGLPFPDWRERFFVDVRETPIEVAYAKFPMGVDGFVTSPCPDRALAIIQRVFGLEGKVVGTLQQATAGMTGVKVQTYNGTTISFSGRD